MRAGWCDGVVLLHALAALACLPGLLRLETSADTRVFYGDNVYHRDLKTFDATFQQNNNVLLLLRHGGERIDASAAFARVLREATTRAWRLPYALRVDSLATAPSVRGAGDDFTLTPVLDALCPDACSADTGGLLDDPLLVSRLVSKDATTVAVYVAFDLPFASTTAVQAITGAVRDLAADLARETTGLETRFVGGITMMDAFNEAANRDAGSLIPIVLVLLFALLVLVLGDFRLIGLLVGTGVYGSIVAMGLAGWLGMQVNAATSIVPVLIVTLAVASGLHLLVTFVRQVHTPDGTSEQAVAMALDLNRRPIVLTAVLSFFGFVSMNFADSPPLRDLGNLVAVGLVAATTLLLYVVPKALGRLRRVRALPTSRWTGAFVEWLASGIGERRGTLAAGLVLAFAAIALAGLPRIELNDDFVEYFDESFEFRRSADYAEVHMGGPNYVDIAIRAPAEEGIYEPAYMEMVGEFGVWLRQDPLVASVVSVADVLGNVAEAFTGSRSLEGRTREEIAQWLLTYELSLTAGQDLEDFFDKTRRSTRVSVLLSGGNSQSVVALESRIYAWFEPYRRAGYDVVVTGINVPVAHMSLLNVRSMLVGIALSLALSALVLGWYFRSAKILLLTAPAIFLPSAMGFGLWGWIAGDIGLAASVVAAMTIGIVIDDAVHIIYRYQHTRDLLHESPRSAARATVGSVGLSILATSVALAVGFLVLGLSGFEVNRTLGLCTTIILLCGLVVDLMLVPRVLVWLDEHGRTAAR
jgi:hypothetical protein